MSDITSIFKVVFATGATLGGLSELKSGVEGFMESAKEKARSLNETIEAAGPLLEKVAAVFGGRELLEYANEAEKANVIQAQLNDAIARTGEGAAELKRELDELTESLMKKTGVDDDEIMQVEEKLLRYGATKDSIKELTALTLDFASFMKMDVASAADQMGRGIMGGEVAMRGLKFEIDTTKPKAEQVKELMAKLTAAIGGMSERENEATGGMKALGTEFGNAQKAIGQIVLQVRNPFIKGFADQIRDAAHWLSDFATKMLTPVAGNKALVVELKEGATTLDRFAGRIAAFGAVALAFGSAFTLGKTVVQGFLAVLAFSRIPAFVAVIYQVISGMGAAATAFATGASGATALGAALGVMGSFLVLASAALGSFSLGKMIAEIRLGEATIGEWVESAELEILGTWTSIRAFLENTWANIKFAFAVSLEAMENTATISWNQILSDAASFAQKLAAILNSALPQKLAVPTSWLDAQKAQADAKVSGATQALMNPKSLADRDAAVKQNNQDAADDRKAAEDANDRLWMEIHQRADAEAAAAPTETKSTKPQITSPSAPKTAGGKPEAATNQDLTRQATEMLSNAERQYQIQIERTQLLQQSGAITQQEADRQESAAIRAYIASLQTVQQRLVPIIAQLKAMGKSDDAQKVALQFEEVANKITEAKLKLSDMGFFGQVRAQLRSLSQEWANLGQQVGQFFTNTLNTGINAAAQGLAGLITRTGNWRQSFAQAATGIITDLIRIVLQYTVGRALIAAINLAFGKTEAASTNTAASTSAAAWAPAATSASIASYGAAAGTGLAAYLAALAVGTAAGAGASAATGAAGYASGGYTGDAPTHQVAGIVHGREFVISAPAVKHYGRNFLENINARQAAPMPITKSSGGAISARGGSSGGGSAKVIVVDDGRQAKRLLATKDFRGAVVQSVSKNRAAAGLRRG